jgi:rRNA maturation endonuclease Nob1
MMVRKFACINTDCKNVSYSAAEVDKCEKCGGPMIESNPNKARTDDLRDTEGAE